MNIDVLARMRDAADTLNIAPVISGLLQEGYVCAIVCDTPGKAYQTLTKHFPHLLPLTKQLDSCDELYKAYPGAKVYFGSMLPNDIGRDPFSYYKKHGALTVTIQETPGWRLTNWDVYPDVLFTMPGGAAVVKTVWSDFDGSIHETGMPQYENIANTASEVNVAAVRTSLNISENTRVISVNIPAYYALETSSIITETVVELRGTTFLCSIHPKASDNEKNEHHALCEMNSNIINSNEKSLIESFSISDFTIGCIASTTLVTASLCGSIPIALTNPAAQKKLIELGGYEKPTDFPYVQHNHFSTARNTTELLHILQSKSIIDPFTVIISTEKITAKIKEYLSNNQTRV